MNYFLRRRAWLGLMILLPPLCLRSADTIVDVVIYGGNAAGAVAAVQVSRMGGTVVLLEPSPAIGGLTTGGLGATDVGDKRAVGGVAHEFYRRIYDYYEEPAAWRSETRAAYVPRHPLNISDSMRLHWFFEPHVATRILNEFLSAAKVPVHLNARLDRTRGVRKENGRITAITLLDGRVFRGRTFIDATYEGDLMAAAGVSYAIGREPNSRYAETLNGIRFVSEQSTAGIDPFVRPGDPSSGLLPRVDARAPGKEGDGHEGVQAYNFRVCLTDVPENRVPFVKPARYDPLNYELLLRSITGRNITPGPQLFTLSPMPNRKTDTNNRNLFSTDYVGRSHRWAEASYEERDLLWQEHKDYTQGFFWFLENDPRVPENVRRETSRWGLAKDEFTATDHWPFQLYVREARRLVGEAVVTEHDCRRKNVTTDPVALASYAMDSHAVGMFVDEQRRLRIEGAFLETIGAFPISYRALLPKRTECTNLIVPVCLSASHVAYGSVRMEPVFMMLGQAAATAAMLAQQRDLTLHTLPYATLRARLLADGQVLEALPRVNPGRGLKGPASPEATAAVEKLQRLGFLAAAEASVNTWQTAARPGATVEASRVIALIIAAAQRFDASVVELKAALAVLAKNKAPLDSQTSQLSGGPEDMLAGETVAPLLVQLAAAFP
jgi:hypothetical protein